MTLTADFWNSGLKPIRPTIRYDALEGFSVDSKRSIQLYLARYVAEKIYKKEETKINKRQCLCRVVTVKYSQRQYISVIA